MFHRQETILRKGTGLAVAGAQVAVKVSGGSAAVQLYSANDLSKPLASPVNVVTTDENGRYDYWVPNGVYDETASYGSIVDTEVGIQMFDLSNPLVGSAAWGSLTGSLAAQADLAAALAAKASTSALAAIASTGSASDLSSGTVPAARLPTYGAAAVGAVPASGGGIVNFLRADGTWAPPPGSAGGGALIGSGYTMTPARLIGRTTAGSGAPEELTAAQAKTFLAIGVADVSGLAAIATSGSGADLTANSVALAKLPTQATATFLGNISGGAAVPSALTAAQVKSALGITGADINVPVASQTGTAYTAALADAGTYIRFSNAAAITFTVPPNSAVAFPIGTVIEIEQAAAGALSVAAGAGVAILSRGADTTLAGQFAVAALKKVATDTWVLTGDL